MQAADSFRTFPSVQGRKGTWKEKKYRNMHGRHFSFYGIDVVLIPFFGIGNTSFFIADPVLKALMMIHWSAFLSGITPDISTALRFLLDYPKITQWFPTIN